MTQTCPLAREYQGLSFSLLAAPGREYAPSPFPGSFQDREMVWIASLLTLARFHAEQPDAGLYLVSSAVMEIGGETAHGRAICVALDIPLIDEAAILRTMIMIRHYKRLHSGRHEFGEPRGFPPRTAG